MSYTETVEMSEEDFTKKFGLFYDETGDFQIQEVVIVNPTYSVNPDVAKRSADMFGQHSGVWDENCAASIYFLDQDGANSDWLMKYEICFAEDGIEHGKNGDLDYVKHVSDKFQSSYH